MEQTRGSPDTHRAERRAADGEGPGASQVVCEEDIRTARGERGPEATASEPSTATNLIRVMPAKGAEHVWRIISTFSSSAGG